MPPPAMISDRFLQPATWLIVVFSYGRLSL